MNNLDKQYTDLLQDILDNGVRKEDRTGTGTISVFGRQIRHKMSEGFPVLTTKKMAWKTMVTELLWFLRGDTNIKFLVDNNCHIWDGDAYKNYEKWWKSYSPGGAPIPLSKEMFIDRIKTDNEFANKWGELGPVYGAGWRNWGGKTEVTYPGVRDENGHLKPFHIKTYGIDQIANLINDLKTNPDSRRLMVNAWNVGELDSMTLPPCHYGFQIYTRELSLEERRKLANHDSEFISPITVESWDRANIPTRAISLMWNQRSVDTFLGLPFNIASYGLLLEIIAKLVNMVPDELIGNLGDTHLYLNHIEQAKEQIGRELTLEERHEIALPIWKENYGPLADMMVATNIDNTPYRIPTRTREPYPLPTLNINTEWWPTESGESGIGPISTDGFLQGLDSNIQHFIRCLIDDDLQLVNYQSHPSIKAPLSN